MKKFIVLLCILCLFLSGCTQNKNNQSSQNSGSQNNTQSAQTPQQNGSGGSTSAAGASLVQFTGPKAGDQIAVITTSMGVIKVQFFPQYAPNAVQNFVTHSKQGYYNGLIFHRVINNFMIQSGDPLGNGTGGQSIWGKPFNDEITPQLHNFRGALAMANSGPNTNGSQFFIVQAKQVQSDMIQQMESAGSTYFPSNVIDKYKKVGGAPWLDYHYTVFGQVFEGMDVVDKIAAVKTDSNDKPLQKVKLEKIQIETYK